MKIVAYEVREDEAEIMKKLAGKLGIDELVTTAEPLTLDTVHLAEGAAGVTTLGQSIIDEKVCQALKNVGVKGYSTRTVGYNHVNLKAAAEAGIRVSNATYSPHGVAEYTVMLILMTLRNYKPALYRINVNDYSLNGLIGKELHDMTVGIIRTGKIGAAVIQNLSGFGCKLLAHSRHEDENVKKYATYVDMDTIYSECDIISFHTPLNDSTYHMVNKRTISKMKKGVILINCARGELMNIADITTGIEDEQIGALALDVFENENGIYHHDRKTDIIKNKDMAYLRQFPNVIMTQHMAFYTEQAVVSMVHCGLESLVAFAENKEYRCQLQ